MAKPIEFDGFGFVSGELSSVAQVELANRIEFDTVRCRRLEIGMVNKVKTVEVLERAVAVQTIHDADYICITDIGRYKDPERTDDLIRNWIRNRNTIEFLGIWELINNPGFKPVEFDGFRKQAGLNMALFGMTAKQWRDSHPEDKGNIRDHANVSQLVCLSNLENLNALFINDGLEQSERLSKLNRIAIKQMRILTTDAGLKRLEGGAK